MATQLADILFAVIAAAIVVAQALILRSTARGIRHAGGAGGAGVVGVVARTGRPALEWTYAILPALALALLLLASWQAMHPETIRVRGVTPQQTSGT